MIPLTIVGLIHDAEQNFGVTCIVFSKLCPQAHKLSISGPALADDPTVPAGIYHDLVFVFKVRTNSYSCGCR